MATSRVKSGFTLIEILIVIVIVAVMASVVVPAYVRYLSHVRFQAKTREVQDIFAYAREQALVLDSPVTLTFDRQSESFAVSLPTAPVISDQPAAMSNGDSAVNNAATSQVAKPPRVLQLNANQMVTQYSVTPPTTPLAGSGSGTAGGNDLHFQPDGTVEAMEMVIAQADGAEAHLTLFPATGRLTLDGGGGR